MSAQATPAYGTTPAVALTLDGKGDSRLSWAAIRLQQKLWLEENNRAKGVTTQRLVAYLRSTGLGFFVLGGVTGLFSVLAPVTLPAHARLGLGVFGLVIAAVGLALAGFDVIAAMRHNTNSPLDTVKTFFRAVLRGSFTPAYSLLLGTERNGVIRPVPKVPGLANDEFPELTFDSPNGFAAYWEHTLHRSRPDGWRDDYSKLSSPFRWVSLQNVRQKRVSRRMVVVSSTLTIHHVPIWAFLSLLLGVLPALFVIPRYSVKVQLVVQKALVQTRQGWRLVNGELVSAEDLAGLKLAAS